MTRSHCSRRTWLYARTVAAVVQQSCVNSVVSADGAGLPWRQPRDQPYDVGAILSGRTNDATERTRFRVRSQARYVRCACATAWVQLTQKRANRPSDQADTVFESFCAIRASAPTTRRGCVSTVEASQRPTTSRTFPEQVGQRATIRDAFEALRKLRPSMLYDGDRCRHEPVDNVWINGRRVLFMAQQTPVFGARQSEVRR